MRECGEIMGVTGELSEDSPASNGPMGVLDHVFKRLIRFKMLNQVILINVLSSSTSCQSGIWDGNYSVLCVSAYRTVALLCQSGITSSNQRYML